jgi:hypothetical protein
MSVPGTKPEIMEQELHRRVLIDTRFQRALDALSSVDLLVRELQWWNQRGGSLDPNPVSEFLEEIGYVG